MGVISQVGLFSLQLRPAMNNGFHSPLGPRSFCLVLKSNICLQKEVQTNEGTKLPGQTLIEHFPKVLIMSAGSSTNVTECC